MGDELVLRLVQGAIDFQDGTLFGNDAGEDELPDVLNSYFVDQPAFKQFFNRNQPFQVARSRKGMGKSALLSKLAFDLERADKELILINLTGAKLLGLSPPPTGANHLELQNYWSRLICASINYAIGARLGFTFSDATTALVDSAELATLKDRNIAGALLNRIKSSKVPIELTSVGHADPDTLLMSAVERSGNTRVWLLVDDIDSTYIDSPEQRALTSTFFSACRALAREVKGLSIRASVRTDVWSALRQNEDLDKCEQYVTDISWSAADMKTILSKKVYSYLERTNMQPQIALDYAADADQVLELAFEARMKWGASRVPPFRPIYILSAGRPRWMSQLCRLAGMQAAKAHAPVIVKAHVNAIEKVYSRLRLNDIYKEHSHQYLGLEKLIETFANSPARYATADLLSQLMRRYVNGVGANNVPELDGVRYSMPLQLAHFLYKVGFIVGRREHAGEGFGADFTRYEERPELLSDGRNPDDGLLWEVHPAYREALSIGKVQRSANEAERRRGGQRSKRSRSEAPRRRKSRPRKV